jgi:hypothetical protein
MYKNLRKYKILKKVVENYDHFQIAPKNPPQTSNATKANFIISVS